MFRVGDVILSEDIATAKFACDITRCKGACCVIGDAGAPVHKNEIPVLRKAFNILKDRLAPEAVDIVEAEGVVKGDSKSGYEVNCVENRECIFVQKDENGIATCAIQSAYYNGEINWEKPLSCHLYPVRMKEIAGMEYANFEYIESLCSTACDNGEKTGTYLSDFLKSALSRRYGEDWISEFDDRCKELRNGI